LVASSVFGKMPSGTCRISGDKIVSFPSFEFRRVLRLAVGLFVPALTAACGSSFGSQGPLHWAKLGASYDQFMEARYACIQADRSNGYVTATGAPPRSPGAVSLSFFKACMENRGWYVNQAGYAPPPSEEVRME
jgi:hypothetical protein